MSIIDVVLKLHSENLNRKRGTLSNYKVLLILNALGKKNFHYLCQLGCPQATHERMFVNSFQSVSIADNTVIIKSKKFLAEYGY